MNETPLTNVTNTFTLGNITWDTPGVSKATGKIAPGDRGTVTIEIDATGSEVDVDYDITIDTEAIDNNQFTVGLANGSAAGLTGTIRYNDDSKVKTVTLEIKWLAEDNATANQEDLDLNGQAALQIPVTVLAVQNPNHATATPEPDSP